MTGRLAVVIPTLDEAARIGRQLEALSATPGIREIVVADGGSTDGTPEIVRGSGLARFVEAPAGRGPQMNAGARLCGCEVVLFLHADVVLPPDAPALIAAALEDPSVVGGAFRTHTVTDRPSWLMSRLVRLADVRSRYTRVPYGDQAIFARRGVFEAVGGFPDQPLFEDVELSRRLRRLGRLETVDASVQVSGRRFEAHPLYFAVLMNVLPVLYRLGVPTETLARAYGHVR